MLVLMGGDTRTSLGSSMGLLRWRLHHFSSPWFNGLLYRYCFEICLNCTSRVVIQVPMFFSVARITVMKGAVAQDKIVYCTVCMSTRTFQILIIINPTLFRGGFFWLNQVNNYWRNSTLIWFVHASLFSIWNELLLFSYSVFTYAYKQNEVLYLHCAMVVS